MQDLCLSFIDEAQSIPILNTIVPTEYEIDIDGKTMQDLCLSFIDEAQSIPILYTIVPPEYELDENGELTDVVKTESYLQPNYQNISVIGTVYQRPPEPLPKDYEPIPYPAPNWGVNIRLLDDEDIEPLKPYIVEPRKPVRVWA